MNLQNGSRLLNLIIKFGAGFWSTYVVVESVFLTDVVLYVCS